MNLLELFILAVGLSMDAFAVAVCTGLTLPKATVKKSAVVGLYFGFFQAAMPLIGYLVATWFADRIVAYDHWIAFVLLGFLGGKMIGGSFRKEEDAEAAMAEVESADWHAAEAEAADRDMADAAVNRTATDIGAKIAGDSGDRQADVRDTTQRPGKMLTLAVATSIDALAVGVSFAFLRVNVITAVSLIGVITFVLSAVGVKIGNVFGSKLKTKAELAGGIILVLIGIKILLEHLGVISL